MEKILVQKMAEQIQKIANKQGVLGTEKVYGLQKDECTKILVR